MLKGETMINISIINESSMSPYLKEKLIVICESSEKSKLAKNFKEKSPIDYKIIDIHSEEAKKWYSQILDFIDLDPEAKIKYFNLHFVGKILVTKDNDFIGYCIVMKKWRYDADSGKHYTGKTICQIKVKKKYRGYGFGNILLDICIKKLNANMLLVHDDNEIAFRMYKKHGFKEVGKMNWEGKATIMMR